MANGRTLFVVALILAVFGALAVAGGPALSPGDAPERSVATDPQGTEDEDGNTSDATGADEPSEDGESVPAVVDECAAEPPEDFADPESDDIGWVDGYWYDEPLDINASGGITEDELDRLVARTAARVEAMRCINADEGVPPVDIQTREQFQEEQAELFEDVSDDERLFDNAVYETLLLVDSETNSVDQRQANRGASVGGTYNFLEGEINIVSDDPENLSIDEEVLAHEIGHAVQDQQFNLSSYERPTTDIDKGTLGLIEGDVTLIEQQYLEACENGEWKGGCVTESSGSEADSEPANWGLYFQSFQPYSDGPAFVESVYEQRGWEGVNELYEDPPSSAVQIVEPDRYPELQPGEVTVPDESTAEWDRLSTPEGPGYDTPGIASISAMFMAPLYESSGAFTIYEAEEILNGDGALSPLEYHHPEPRAGAAGASTPTTTVRTGRGPSGRPSGTTPTTGSRSSRATRR
ncbi:MAG: Hvo_1808 family surface protein [Natrialbaceae archaeon]